MIETRCVRISNSFTSIFNLELNCNQYKILFIILYYAQFRQITEISYRCFSEIGTSRFQNRRKNNIIAEIKSMIDINICLRDNIRIGYDTDNIIVELGKELNDCIKSEECYYRVNINELLRLTSVYAIKMYFIIRRSMNKPLRVSILKFDELIGNNYNDAKKYRYKVISRAVDEFRDKLGITLNIKSDRKFIEMTTDDIENNYLCIE